MKYTLLLIFQRVRIFSINIIHQLRNYSMQAIPNLIKKMFLTLWRTINIARKIILNLIFLSLVLAVLFTIGDDNSISVPDSSALVLNLSGKIVDQKKFIDPWQSLLTRNDDNNGNNEILLSDIIDVIDNATQDNRIKVIVLDLSHLSSSGISKMQQIGEAITRFKNAGKDVFSYGNFYDQQQYYLASFANEIYLNPEGAVLINGLANYRLYFKSALEKLKINAHVFRVGSYKSAVEPYIRNTMSKEAKESNLSLMTDLWHTYTHVVANNRHINSGQLALTSDSLLKKLDIAKGSSAQLAINQKWIDHTYTYDEFTQLMINKVGFDANKKNYRQIKFNDYLSTLTLNDNTNLSNNIAIIVANGTILNGKQPAGSIGGESTSALLRQARYDQSVKAVVLRVNSPGGSAFASEQIRQEVLALKKLGKPVVISMGAMAASGGYWISASADYIYATPATITGSIGIFGMFATFENTLDSFGIHTDGVATTDWAGLSPTRALSHQVSQIIQRHIERGYEEFIHLVANSRHMSIEKVNSIAQGRVWTGNQALKLGLVDAIGDMNDAITKAAELAKVSQFGIKKIELKLSPEQELMQTIFSSVVQYLPNNMVSITPMEKLLTSLSNEVSLISSFNDPKYMYLYCDTCNIQ